MTEDQGTESDSPTKLVYLINSLYTGGAEIGLCRLLQGLDSERYDVTVVVLWGHEPELVDRIPDWVAIVDLELTRRPNFSACPGVVRSLYGADVIVGSLYHASFLAKMAGVVNSDATVATWQHNPSFKSSLRESLFVKTSFLNDVLLADSDAVADTMSEEFGIPTDLVHTVPIAGIDLDEYTPRSHGPSDPVTVGSVGRIIEEKNYSLLLNVADHLSDSNIRFEIVGGGDRLHSLRQSAKDRRLSNITFHGALPSPKIADFLSGTDIYIQPSRQEGLCITVLEAMAAGLPVVGSEVGGIAQNVEHGISGFTYRSTDLEGFISGLQELAADPELREQFGNRGREIVEEQFTRDVLVTEFETAISEG